MHESLNKKKKKLGAVMMNPFAGKEWRHRYGEWTCGHSGGRREGNEWRK